MGPITRSRTRPQSVPAPTRQPKETKDRKEDPRDKHPARPPPRRSPRRQYLTSDGIPTDKAPTN